MNIFLFMVAGYATTAVQMAYSTYILAKHRDVQQKLQAEIDQHWPTDGKEPDYEVIAEMPYLDIFLREVLRMYTFSSRVRNRVCNTTTNVCGHQIDKGKSRHPFD